MVMSVLPSSQVPIWKLSKQYHYYFIAWFLFTSNYIPLTKKIHDPPISVSGLNSILNYYFLYKKSYIEKTLSETF